MVANIQALAEDVVKLDDQPPKEGSLDSYHKQWGGIIDEVERLSNHKNTQYSCLFCFVIQLSLLFLHILIISCWYGLIIW